MDGEAGWWSTSGNIGLPPLARVMGVGRQQQNKATDESGMITEYVKALGDQDLNNLRRLLNDVLMGGCIPKEWKES